MKTLELQDNLLSALERAASVSEAWVEIHLLLATSSKCQCLKVVRIIKVHLQGREALPIILRRTQNSSTIKRESHYMMMTHCKLNSDKQKKPNYCFIMTSKKAQIVKVLNSQRKSRLKKAHLRLMKHLWTRIKTTKIGVSHKDLRQNCLTKVNQTLTLIKKSLKGLKNK